MTSWGLSRGFSKNTSGLLRPSLQSLPCGRPADHRCRPGRAKREAAQRPWQALRPWPQQAARGGKPERPGQSRLRIVPESTVPKNSCHTRRVGPVFGLLPKPPGPAAACAGSSHRLGVRGMGMTPQNNAVGLGTARCTRAGRPVAFAAELLH